MPAPRIGFARSSEQHGFTLIELLVVILIIGILAAIAIPSFLNQRSKASDASAKELARTAQTAAETLGTDRNGSYLTVTPAALNQVEPTIPITASTTSAYLSAAAPVSGGLGYTVTATAEPDGNTFTITRAANGVVTRTCALGGASAGGCVNSSW